MTWAMAFESFTMAAFLAFGLGRLCMAVALRMRWVDRPGHRKIHRRPIPYLGGFALFLALGFTVLALYFLFGLRGLGGLSGFSLPSLLACAWPAGAACLLGLWDDLFDMRPRYKFVGQIIFALAFSQFAYRFATLHIPGFSSLILEPELSVLVTAFFIVAVANGYNMIDGSDALCLGSAFVTLWMIAVAAHWQAQPHLVFLSAAGAGACLGLLYWNRPPARIYSGDAGSQGLGFLVACLLVALGKGEPGLFDVGLASEFQPAFHYKIMVACLMVGWPALEVLLTVARRFLQGRGLGRADQGHLHHRLAKIGLKAAPIVWLAMAMNLVCASIVLAFMAGQKGLSVLLMLPLAALVSLGVLKLGYMRFFKRAWLDDRRPHFAIAGHFAAMQAAKLKLARDCDEVLILVEQICHEFGVHACRVNLKDSGGKRRVWSWTGTLPVPSHRVVRDRVRVASVRNHASWSVDVHDDREPELSMNLRVVMVEFMRQALERAGELDGELAHGNAVLFVAAQDHASAERRLGERKAAAMSIKGLKQRL